MSKKKQKPQRAQALEKFRLVRVIPVEFVGERLASVTYYRDEQGSARRMVQTLYRADKKLFVHVELWTPDGLLDSAQFHSIGYVDLDLGGIFDDLGRAAGYNCADSVLDAMLGIES